MTRSRALTAAAAVLWALSAASPALAGPNPQFVLPLHAVLAPSAECGAYLPVDCGEHRPAISVPANTEIVVYLFVARYVQIAGVQTAFAWDAGWDLVQGSWECAPGQVSATVPAAPGGPIAGALTTAFDCTSRPALAVIGRWRFVTGESGCLSQVQPNYPFGIHVVACDEARDAVAADPFEESSRLGKICVGAGGVDPCQPIYPVTPATWGRIKASFD